MLWQANIDIQFVAESSLALAHYVSGYVTKAERSNIQDIWHEVSENKNVYSRLWSFGIRCLRSRECGLYEASDLLLGDHLCEKSDTVKWIDISMPHKRNRRLKDHKMLQEIAKENPDTENIFEDNLVDTYYPQRPINLEALCLYDFVANYDWYGKDDSGNRKYKKLTKSRLPNNKLFDPEKEYEREDYYYSLILLFVPFRDESNLLLQDESTEEAFHRLLPANAHCSAYHDKLQKMLKAQSNILKINEARQADGVEEKVNKEDDDPQLMGEAKTAMKEVVEMNNSDTLTLEDRITMLNDDQRRIFNQIKNHLFHQKQHEDNECQCEFKPLRMFVSGVGGTGKSFLIETTKALVNNIWPSNDLTCAIAEPTGLAAFNVGGVTIHRLFQLPIEHDSKTAGYWSLPKTSQKVMKTSLRNVKIIIIDEVSMVSSLNLAYIHLRLEELFGGNDWFGSRNMLFVGDLLQLQPVNGSPVFERITNKTLSYKLGCAASVNIWRDSVVYDELIINERQKKDREFSSMLDSVRCGFPTDETLQILNKKVIDMSLTDTFIDLQQSGKSPVCLFPTRKACCDFNMEMLSSLTSKIHELVCTDEVDETISIRKWNKKASEQLDKLNSDCNKTAGLEAKLSLAVGARVMLRRNLDTKSGLVNGAMGTVLSITSQHVTVQFDHITQPCNIEMVKSKFMVMKNYYVYRKQFPLILAYAITIHKCQGLSLDCAIIDLSENVFSDGMAYVALSRVRSLSGLHLVAFHPKSIMVSINSLQETNRLRKQNTKLPLYSLPTQSKTNRKRKLTSINDQPEPKKPTPCIKILKTTTKPKQKKRALSTINVDCDSLAKKSLSHYGNDYNPRDEQVWPFKFYSVDEQWQHNACTTLGVQFVLSNRLRPGGPNVDLRPPNHIKRIRGDGNCLFRSFSYIITGSEEQHMAVRIAILNHMIDIAHFLLGHHIPPQYSSVQDYIQDKGMDQPHIWGTEIEMFTLAHLLQTCVFIYNTDDLNWCRYSPHCVDRTLNDDIQQMSMYINHPPNHFEIVCSIQQPH